MMIRLSVIYIDSYLFLGLTAPGHHIFTNDGINDLEHLFREGSVN